MMERILITVKTYPTISKKYGELVCTAGLREDGSWVRIYPVTFRRLADESKYPKWSWVELDLVKQQKDPRPESYRPVDLSKMKIVAKIPTDKDWQARKDIVLKKGAVYDNLSELIALANEKNELSLATFKPARIVDFVIEKTDRDWNQETIAILQNQAAQGDLFISPEEVAAQFKVVKKVPYKFSYRLCDSQGKDSTMMIEDWEIGQLYWNCLKGGRTEDEATSLVKQKYWDEFVGKRDIYLFLGTTREWHGRGSNPFVITGVFYPPSGNWGQPLRMEFFALSLQLSCVHS